MRRIKSDQAKPASEADRPTRMLTEQIKLTLKDAAKKLTGSKKRAFMAQVRKERQIKIPALMG